MKKLLVVSLVVLFAISANAQFKLGVTGGLNVAGMTGVGFDKSLMGFHAGLIADISLGPIGVQPGLEFSQKGAKASEGDSKLTLNYIDVPVNLAYKIGLPGAKILLLAGPNFGYGLSGTSSFGGESNDIKFGSEAGQTKRMDLGLNLGGGVQFLKLQGTISYTLGLTNLNNDGGDAVKNNVLKVSLAYFF